MAEAPQPDLEHFLPIRGQFCFSIGARDPVVSRLKRDTEVSGKTGSPSGTHQSETRRDGRFCANSCAKALERI
jgi:hypothetical protein